MITNCDRQTTDDVSNQEESKSAPRESSNCKWYQTEDQSMISNYEKEHVPMFNFHKVCVVLGSQLLPCREPEQSKLKSVKILRLRLLDSISYKGNQIYFLSRSSGHVILGNSVPKAINYCCCWFRCFQVRHMSGAGN